jgi:hypothetical protein
MQQYAIQYIRELTFDKRQSVWWVDHVVDNFRKVYERKMVQLGDELMHNVPSELKLYNKAAHRGEIKPPYKLL